MVRRLGFLLGLSSLSQEVLLRKKSAAINFSGAEDRFVRHEHREQGYWHLLLLGVLPAFRGKGFALQLLQWGLEKADEENRAVYVISSAVAISIYTRAGFTIVGSNIRCPEDPQGGWTETVMVRERKSVRDGHKE